MKKKIFTFYLLLWLLFFGVPKFVTVGYANTLPIKEQIHSCFNLIVESKYEWADKCFRNVLLKDPKNVMAYNGLGLVLYNQNEFDKQDDYKPNVYVIPPNLNRESLGIVNNGTKANPVAGATVSISYSVDSVISSSKSDVSYHFVGDGQIREI